VRPVTTDLEQLGAGEEELWSGTTARPPAFDRVDALIFFFIVVALVSGTIFAIDKWPLDPPLSFAYLAYAAVMVFLMVRHYRRRRSTDRRYLVTNVRVVAVDRGKARSAALRALPEPVLHTTDDTGIGTITFGRRPNPWTQLNAETSRRAKPTPIALIEIADAREAYETILEVQSGPIA